MIIRILLFIFSIEFSQILGNCASSVCTARFARFILKLLIVLVWCVDYASARARVSVCRTVCFIFFFTSGDLKLSAATLSPSHSFSLSLSYACAIMNNIFFCGVIRNWIKFRCVFVFICVYLFVLRVKATSVGNHLQSHSTNLILATPYTPINVVLGKFAFVKIWMSFVMFFFVICVRDCSSCTVQYNTNTSARTNRHWQTHTHVYICANIKIHTHPQK